MNTVKILLITYDNCDDSEVLYPLYRLQEENWPVTVASMEKRVLHAKYHFTVEATHTLDEIDPDDYDGLLLPGGMAPEKIRQNSKALDIVKRFIDEDKPVASICHGQQILISAKVLKNRRCTAYPGIADDIVNAGALYENCAVVRDGNLVTSRRPGDLPVFMRSFIELIKQKP